MGCFFALAVFISEYGLHVTINNKISRKKIHQVYGPFLFHFSHPPALDGIQLQVIELCTPYN
jgi:hypothetical protein